MIIDHEAGQVFLSLHHCIIITAIVSFLAALYGWFHHKRTFDNRLEDIVEAIEDDAIDEARLKNLFAMIMIQSRNLGAKIDEQCREECKAEIDFCFFDHLERQAAWSKKTFGPGERTLGIVDHIEKELREIKAAPDDLEEWIDVVILALDGAWRIGATPLQIIDMLEYKQRKNESRNWPDWKEAEPGKAIEHIRDNEDGK